MANVSIEQETVGKALNLEVLLILLVGKNYTRKRE
jgi:hypothetical protein